MGGHIVIPAPACSNPSGPAPTYAQELTQAFPLAHGGSMPGKPGGHNSRSRAQGGRKQVGRRAIVRAQRTSSLSSEPQQQSDTAGGLASGSYALPMLPLSM